MGRIAECFARRREMKQAALVAFVTAGDPSLDLTAELIPALAEAGADIIELGVPFSDPMADGPVIQASSLRALEKETTLSGILDMVAKVREKCDVPLVLMGYYNPIFAYGAEQFARAAGQAGVDGVLLVDLPPEEAGELQPALKSAGVEMITLLAPTSPPERQKKLAAKAEGFLYYVSMTGVTGTAEVDSAAIKTAVTDLIRESPVPVAVGFGVNTPEAAGEIATFSDGVVVGSALVRLLQEAGPENAVPHGVAFVRSLRAGMDGD